MSVKTNSKRAAGSESREGWQKSGAAHPAAKLWLARGSEVWPNRNHGYTHANLVLSPALQLHLYHLRVFPMKSCCITLSNLLPAAGTGRTAQNMGVRPGPGSHPTPEQQNLAPANPKTGEWKDQCFVGRHQMHVICCTCIPECAFWKVDA